MGTFNEAVHPNSDSHEDSHEQALPAAIRHTIPLQSPAFPSPGPKGKRQSDSLFKLANPNYSTATIKARKAIVPIVLNPPKSPAVSVAQGTPPEKFYVPV